MSRKLKLAHPQWGERRDQEQLKVLGMRKGRIYTETARAVYAWRTEIELAEFPGYIFNSINFVEVQK